MPLDPQLTAAIAPFLDDRESIAVAGFSICSPGPSALTPRLAFPLAAGQSPLEWAEAQELSWSPSWLLDAGHQLRDHAGRLLAADSPASVAGPVEWDSASVLCRVDDQVKDDAREPQLRRRLAGEVAVLGLWSEAAVRTGVPLTLRPDPPLSGGTRGSRFKDFLVHVLRHRLPDGWSVEPEVALTKIRGLHMRKDVGQRSSDIVVTDGDRRLIAVISSKWTWRSDRGTEAAQMVPLSRYRPDVPYALVTAEFPRAKTVSQESIEDRAYHLVPEWVGAWIEVNSAATPALESLATLEDLKAAGTRVSTTLGLPDLFDLITDLTDAGTIV